MILAAYTHKEWKLTDIINVTVNKDEKSIDDENDEIYIRRN